MKLSKVLCTGLRAYHAKGILDDFAGMSVNIQEDEELKKEMCLFWSKLMNNDDRTTDFLRYSYYIRLK